MNRIRANEDGKADTTMIKADRTKAKEIKSAESLVYLDNNGTTFMSDDVKQIMLSAMDQGNPSGTYAIAERSKKIIDKAKSYLLDVCEVSSDDYLVIFTSGGSESNNYILRTVAEAYRHEMGERPHIIISAIEHKTSLLCCERLQHLGIADVSYVYPTSQGDISASDVARYIKQNTCLISVMHINNETGIINNIKAIGEVAHKHNIPFHCDAVQSFGKYGFNPNELNADAFSISFHKLYGPTGIGAIVIKKALVHGYNLCALICGTQNDGLRGGTESAFLIAGALACMRDNFKNRQDKNEKLLRLKKLFFNKISKKFNVTTWRPDSSVRPGFNMIVYGGINITCPNTILFSLIYVSKDGSIFSFCNRRVRDMLDENKIIVALGSACSKGTASHVLTAMKVGDFLKKSVIRISFGDYNSEGDVDRLVATFGDISARLLVEFNVAP